jgi:2'-5' RNA ligase
MMTDRGEHWRLFLALEVPDETRSSVAQAIAPLAAEHADHLRFTDPASWHLTLAFLGALDPSWADVIEDAMVQAAAKVAPFAVTLGRAGRFGRGILWLGFDDPSYASILTLNRAVRSALAARDVPHDTKPLHPHLSLARQRDRDGLGVSRSRLAEVDAAMARLRSDSGGDGIAIEAQSWAVTRLVLLRSHLGDGSPRHEPIARVALRA